MSSNLGKSRGYYICTLFSIWITILTGCHKNEPIIPDVPDAAYVRVFTDFNAGGANSNGYLYINGKLDSINAIPLKSSAANDLDQYSIGAFGGDPKRTFSNDSYYSFGTIFLTGYANYFPSYYDRVKTAPIIGQFDFYKWAKLPQGAVRLTFTTRLVKGGESGLSTAGKLLDTTLQVQKAQLYTMMLIRNLANTAYTLINFNEKPEATSFDAGNCYIRFVNASLASQNIPDELDVYLQVQRLDAPNPPNTNNYSNGITIIDNQLIGTIKGKFNTASEFIKVPALADTAFYKNNVLRLDLELPGFIFKFYPKGASPASGNPPLFYLQSGYGPKTLAYNDIFFYTGYPFPGSPEPNMRYPYVFDKLGRVHPTIATVVFGVRTGKAFGLTRYVWEPANASDGFRR